MKKLCLSLAALLLCLLAHSQEADGAGKYAEFHLIPRFDFNPYTSLGSGGDGSSGCDFGSSSIYTLFEGAFSDNISFTLSNHWLSTTPGELYTSTFRSDYNNWVDMCLVDFSLGAFDIVLGKDMICTGGTEYEDWDVDVDDILSSNFWNTFQPYQWGAKVGVTFLKETTSFWLQAVTSPYGERPFASKLFTYSAQIRGEYGPYSNIWSVSAVQRDEGQFDYVAYLGNMLELGDWTLTLDWSNSTGMGEYNMLGGNMVLFTSVFAPSEKWDVGFKGNYYITKRHTGLEQAFNGGLSCHYYPLGNEMLRIHANVGYDTFESCLCASIGVKLNLTLFSL